MIGRVVARGVGREPGKLETGNTLHNESHPGVAANA